MVNLPTNFAMRGTASYSRFPPPNATIDPYNQNITSGDMVATLVFTSAKSATPSPAWNLIYSHKFDKYTYYAATITNAPAYGAVDTAWTLDWTGVVGDTTWIILTIRFYCENGSPPNGLLWDYKVINNDGVGTGTWVTVTDIDWLYSVPLMVGENCSYLYRTYGTNSYGHDAFDNWYQDAWSGAGTLWTANPQNADPSIPSIWAPGAVDQQIWSPDQYYDSDIQGTPPSNATIRLGIKPRVISPLLGSWGLIAMQPNASR